MTAGITQSGAASVRTVTGPVMIVAGGTGGHVFPGLAVADVLRAQAVDVFWLGTHRGLEAELVPARGIDIEWISIAGLRGRGALAWLAAPFRLAVAVTQALKVLRRRRPTVVLGMGGFVSGPGGFAAWLSRRPLVIHEQNAVPGTTNRWLAPLARRVFEAFPGSFANRDQAQCIGNPVRASIEALASPAERFAARAGSRPRLLVLGGSRGARALNTLVPAALAQLPIEIRPEVWHQAGAEHDVARDAYAQAGVDGKVVRFIDDVSEAYAWADLAVARAGALTISEMAAAGLGAILVPYPWATDDHQTRNALHLGAVGAAVVIQERDLDTVQLAEKLTELLADRQRLAMMAQSARGTARSGAARYLADACLELARVAA